MPALPVQQLGQIQPGLTPAGTCFPEVPAVGKRTAVHHLTSPGERPFLPEASTGEKKKRNLIEKRK